jgi:hypothetical protein
VITYDLTADPEKDCNIGLVLLDEKNPDFKFIPAYVSGEIGKGKFVSGAKEVRWDFKKEFPEGLHGEGFYFEVTTEYVGGFPWLTAGIGAAAVGGGLFAILGSKKNSGNSTATTLPVPPGRP